jgi:hypothetical protein
MPRSPAHFRKCLQIDELMEYASPAATGFISPLLPLLAKLVSDRPHFEPASGLLRILLRRHPAF